MEESIKSSSTSSADKKPKAEDDGYLANENNSQDKGDEEKEHSSNASNRQRMKERQIGAVMYIATQTSQQSCDRKMATKQSQDEASFPFSTPKKTTSSDTQKPFQKRTDKRKLEMHQSQEYPCSTSKKGKVIFTNSIPLNSILVPKKKGKDIATSTFPIDTVLLKNMVGQEQASFRLTSSSSNSDSPLKTPRLIKLEWIANEDEVLMIAALKYLDRPSAEKQTPTSQESGKGRSAIATTQSPTASRESDDYEYIDWDQLSKIMHNRSAVECLQRFLKLSKKTE